MNPTESVRVALRALGTNKLRAALTMLGMIIGVGSVIALLAIGQGVQASVADQIGGLGSNLLFVAPGATTANRLNTVISLIELGRTQEAVEFATAELEVAQRLTDEVVEAVAEPVLAALLLGKAAQANERGVELVITTDTRIDDGVGDGIGGDRTSRVVLRDQIVLGLVDEADARAHARRQLALEIHGEVV